MPKVCYRPINMKADRLAVIAQANEIIAQYQAAGYPLTLRQLYYQFVARGLWPNTQKDYKRLGDILNDGRMAGLVDWLALEDRTRYVRTHSSWEDPASVIYSAAEGYARDWWEGQPTRVEVWIEKDALVGVIEAVCNEYQVPYLSCRGYTSQSEMWQSAQRFKKRAIAKPGQPGSGGQNTLVLHFGDHDPSGIDMSRDIEDRIRLFMGGAEHRFELRRLALNMNQVERYSPPPNPAKLTDSRCAGYMEIHGNESWELDALEPTVLGNLIRDEIEAVIDQDTMDQVKAEEEAERAQLRQVSDRWVEVLPLLEGR